MNSRVVGSMTTVPKRVAHIQPVLVELLKQPLDQIYLNIPDRSRRGQPYQIPKRLRQFIRTHPRIKLVRCHDHGPITKLLPTLQHEHDDETIIITFDDDIYPLPGMVERMVQALKDYPDQAIGYSGVCWGKFPGYYQLTGTWTQSVEVDWLEGVYSGCYLRKFFDLPELLAFPQRMGLVKELSSNDDHWISGYLASRNINRISLGDDVRDYFKYTPARWIEPLSGRHVDLIREHASIIARFNLEGWYHRSHAISKSYGLYITIIVIGIILLLLLLTWGLF